MKNLKVARRYAKALLLIGKDDGQTETYREQLGDFVSVLESNKDLAAVVSNPIHETAGRKKVLRALLDRAMYAPAVNAFLLLLFEKGRIQMVDSISSEFAKLADEMKGIARASLLTATDLSEETVQKIREGLSRKTGKDVLLEVGKDPALIGGVVARIGDLVLDGSIRTQLSNLKETLKRSEAV